MSATASSKCGGDSAAASDDPPRGDERAVARMHELGAAGPPYPPDLVIAVAQIQEEPEATDLVTNGTQTLQEALAAMGLN